MLTPKTATTLLATLALAALARAVPVDPDYVAPPAPLDPNSDLNLNGIPDWYEPEAYVTPDHLAGFLLDHGAKQFAQGYPAPQPQPNYYAKRDAEADPNWGKGGGFVPYFPQPQPQPQPPFVIPVPQPQPFPFPIPGPGTGPSVCSGNNAVAACCRGDSAGCSVVPQNTSKFCHPFSLFFSLVAVLLTNKNSQRSSWSRYWRLGPEPGLLREPEHQLLPTEQQRLPRHQHLRPYHRHPLDSHASDSTAAAATALRSLVFGSVFGMLYSLPKRGEGGDRRMRDEELQEKREQWLDALGSSIPCSFF